MERVRLSRVAGACAVLYSATIVVAVFLLGSIGLLDAVKATDVLPIMVEHRDTAVIAVWIFVLAPVLLAVAGLGFLEAFGRAGSMMWVAAFAFIGGSLLALIRNIIWLAMIHALAPAYANASEGVQSALATVGRMWLAFGYITGDLLGGTLVAVGVLLFSAAMLRERLGPRWIAWLGFAIALTQGVSLLLVSVPEAFGIVGLVSFVGFVVWMVAAGIVLWRSPRSVSKVCQS